MGRTRCRGSTTRNRLQGWLKGINHPQGAPDLSGITGGPLPYGFDPGGDQAGARTNYAPDPFGMTLRYHEGDFYRIGSSLYLILRQSGEVALVMRKMSSRAVKSLRNAVVLVGAGFSLSCGMLSGQNDGKGYFDGIVRSIFSATRFESDKLYFDLPLPVDSGMTKMDIIYDSGGVDVLVANTFNDGRLVQKCKVVEGVDEYCVCYVYEDELSRVRVDTVRQRSGTRSVKSDTLVVDATNGIATFSRGDTIEFEKRRDGGYTLKYNSRFFERRRYFGADGEFRGRVSRDRDSRIRTASWRGDSLIVGCQADFEYDFAGCDFSYWDGDSVHVIHSFCEEMDSLRDAMINGVGANSVMSEDLDVPRLDVLSVGLGRWCEMVVFAAKVKIY